MPTLHPHTIDYRFNNEPRTHVLELPETTLTPKAAAFHLLQLHFGDAENSLLMPAADADAEDVLHQAELMGITHIRT